MHDVKTTNSLSEIGVVFLSGAGLRQEIWADVVSQLACPALVAEYPGKDGGSAENNAFSLKDYAGHVQRQIEHWGVRRFVLVAHSLGGVIGLCVAQLMPERVVGFVAVGAVIPKNGGSFLSVQPWPKRVLVSTVLRLAGTKPPAAALRQGLCHDLTSFQTESVVAGFQPESVRVYTDGCEAGVPEVPRMYVKLTQDRMLDQRLQDRMALQLAAHRTVSLPSGHLPMLSMPEKLSRVLVAFMATGPDDHVQVV
ncbi:alpha/beta fold hydrolase [Paenibacillus xanthanilyticus]|uniref:Alpha/beta fold hydrolase n=1 Tax=Paenibacillus xanthanilyticus TaxID=1783531 RepID=A0ABV8K2M7_9BACL